MSFLHPEFLYFMLPPLLILFGLLLTQKESQSHLFSKEVIDKLRVSENTLTLRTRNALFFLMAFFMIIALAEPVIDDGTISVKAKSADIMIALDISDSMLAEDVYPSRIKLAKEKALELLKIAPNERIGVIGFAKNSYLVSPLSFDHSAVGFLLSQLDTDSITEKGTNISSMLDVVNKSLNEQSKKYLLILSDGGDSESFTKEIQKAKEYGIVVFVLGLGTQNGAPIKLKDGSFIKQNGNIIVSKLNENISELATSTGGVYIQNSTSSDDIKVMLEEIDRISEKKELKSEEIHRYKALFYFPLAMALILLLIATSSMSKREKLNLPSVFVLFALLFSHPDAKAGVFDFIDLQDAKEAYENKDYEKASTIYKNHAQNTHNGDSYYNAGNSLYKLEKYSEAVEQYEKASFDSKESRAKNFSNIGNAYAKQSTPESLQSAVKSYEKSLEIVEDKPTRENMQAVKKLLEQQEQDSKDENSDKSEESDKQDKKENKDENSKDDSSNSEDKSSDKEDSKNDESQKDDADDKNSKDKSDKEDEKDKSDKNESDSDEKDENKSEENQANENNETEDKKESNSDLEQLSKDEENNSSSSASKNMQQKEMSDAEEAKWIQELESQHSTYMYMLNNKKPKEENENEKPW